MLKLGKKTKIEETKMAETEPKKDEHGCIIGKETWNNESQKCVAIEKKALEKTTDENLTERIIAVMKEYGATLSEQIKADIKVKIDDVVKETRDEAVEAIRKGLGLSKDPVIHLSEVEGLVRKIVLEDKSPGKRTETVVKEKPAEGAEKSLIKPAKEMFAELQKQRGAP